MTDTPRLDLRPSQQSLAEWGQLQKVFAASRREVLELKKDLKNLGSLTQALKAQQVKIQGGAAYAQGLDARASRSVSRTIQDGTDYGRAVGQQKEILRSAREHTEFIRQQGKLYAAQNMQVSQVRNQIGQITDLKQLQKLSDAALLRMGLMQTQNMREQAAEARVLNDLINRRIAALRQEATLNKQTRHENRFVRGRAEQKERLFGDGGAHLMGVQAGLMGNYAMIGAGMGAIYGTGKFLADFDEALHNLQATVVITDGNMVSLRQTILDVAKDTRFMANELAEASVNMGQAGMSAREIEESLKGVAILASATGTDLNQSVDIMTSVLGVFNKSASQTEQIANTITQAVNDSKLSIDKLTLGLQYAGNTAAQSGVSFEELIASMGAISNAGIRSGSTIGTGLRQLLISFQKPSKAFRQTLSDLGLTMDDVDLKVHGLSGAMENLRKAGFTAADSIRSFEVRAAAAYTALSSQIGTMRDLEKAFVNSNAAAKASETQMESLRNRGRQLLSTFQSVAADALAPFVALLGDIAAGMTVFVSSMGPAIATLATFGTALAVVKGVQKLSLLMAGFSTASTVAGTAAAGAATKVGFMSGAIGALGTRMASLLAGPWGLAAAAILGIGSAMYGTIRNAQDLGDEMDVVRTKFDKVHGELESTRQEFETTGERITDLKNRAKALTGEKLDLEAAKIRQEFQDMGIVLPETVDHVDDLITALKNLRSELSEEYLIKVVMAKQALEDMAGITGQQIATTYDDLSAATGRQRRSARNNISGQTADYPEVQQLFRAWGLLDQGLRPELRDNAQLKADIANEVGDALRAAKARLAADPYNDGLDRLITIFEELIFKPYRALILQEQELNKQEDQILRYNQEEAGALVARANEPLKDQIDLYETQASSRFNNVLDPSLSPREQLQAAEQIYADEQVKLAQMAKDIEAVREQANGITPGSGTFAVGSMDATWASGQATIRQGFEDQIGAISEGLEQSLTTLDAHSGNYLAELDQKIAAEMDPILKQGMLQMREMWITAVQRQRDQILSDSIRAAKALGDTEAVADLENDRAASRSGYRQDMTTSAEAQKAVTDAELGRDLNLAQTAIGQHDTSTEHALTTLRNAIADEDNLATQRELLVDLEQYIREQGDVRRGLVEAALSAAQAAEADKRDKPETERLEAALTQHDVDQAEDLRAVAKQIEGNDDTAKARAIADIGDKIRLTNEQYALDMAEMQRQVDLLPDDQGEAKAELIRDMIQARNDKATRVTALQDEILELLSGETTAEAAKLEKETKEAQAAEIQGLSQDTQTFNDEITKALYTAHQENIALIDQAIEQVTTLIGFAKDAEAYRRLEQQGLILLNQKAAAMDAAPAPLVPLTPAQRAAEEEATTSQEASLAQAAVDKADDLRITPNPTFGNNPRVTPPKPDKGNKSKKGGGRKEKSEGEKWAETSKAAVAAYQDLADRGIVTANQAAEIITSTTDQAEKRLEGVDKQVTELYNKMLNGGLQEAEQERLTDLLKEQKDLLDIITGDYAQLGAQLMLNGQYAEGFGLVFRGWSEEALDMDKALKDGLLNTLNAGLTGVTDFFSSVSDGTKSVKDGFRDMAVGVVKAIHQMIAQMLAMKAIMAGMKWINSTFAMDLPIPNFMKHGGSVRRRALGGSAPNRDSELTMLQPGEYVMRKTAVDAIGVDTLNQMNAQGNMVASRSAPPAMQQQKPGGDQTINFYLVDERSQAGAIGPQDILAVVTDDIARGGTTKKLIKSIQMGAM